MKQNIHKQSLQGFTLVELAIVLVIIGLIVGGVLVGSSLIRAAEIRAVGQEYGQWSQAVNTFRVRYHALPGDMSTATKWWGAVNTAGADGNCSDPVNDFSDGVETCNGDGDKSIYSTSEPHRFWQHLSNAGLVKGAYTGVAGPAGTSHAVLGENVPESKYAGGGWGARDYERHPGSGFYFAGHYGHSLFFGAQHFVGMPLEKLLTPFYAWTIDDKFDDGYPNKGKVVAHWWGPCTTAANNADTTAQYDFDNNEVSCSLIFKRAF